MTPPEAPPPDTDVDVDVVVVAHRSRDVLRDCVAPLATWPRAHVVVVDTASGDGALETLAGLAVEAVAAPRNGGFGYGCNLGAARRSAPYVCFLNPDARLAPGDLARLVDRLEADPSAAVAGPRLEDEHGALELSRRRFPRLRSTLSTALFVHRLAPRSAWADEVVRDPERYVEPGPVDWLSGACLLVRRAAFDAAGGFDEGYFLYSEETDLCRRLRDAGWRTVFEPSARAVHIGGASAPRAGLLATQVRSRVRYAAIHEGAANARATALALALGALAHLPVAAGRPGQARGRRLAFRAAISAARHPPGPGTVLPPPAGAARDQPATASGGVAGRGERPSARSKTSAS